MYTIDLQTLIIIVLIAVILTGSFVMRRNNAAVQYHPSSGFSLIFLLGLLFLGGYLFFGSGNSNSDGNLVAVGYNTPQSKLAEMGFVFKPYQESRPTTNIGEAVRNNTEPQNKSGPPGQLERDYQDRQMIRQSELTYVSNPNPVPRQPAFDHVNLPVAQASYNNNGLSGYSVQVAALEIPEFAEDNATTMRSSLPGEKVFIYYDPLSNFKKVMVGQIASRSQALALKNKLEQRLDRKLLLVNLEDLEPDNLVNFR